MPDGVTLCGEPGIFQACPERKVDIAHAAFHWNEFNEDESVADKKKV